MHPSDYKNNVPHIHRTHKDVLAATYIPPPLKNT